MYFNQDAAISLLNSKPMKLGDHFTHLSSNISSTENNVNIHIGKVWTDIDRLTILGKSDLEEKIKQEFFQAVHV